MPPADGDDVTSGQEPSQQPQENAPRRRRKHRRAVRPGTGPEPLVDRRRYETDGASATSNDDDDERFLRDVPPHWS